MHRLMSVSLAFAMVASLGCIRPEGAKKTLSGQELYAACASCHGEGGAGNASIAAPNIAGLPAWYVEAQLAKYRSGVRGYHPEDHEGLRMRPMSRQMMDEAEVKAVSTYVATLQAVKSPPSIQGGDATAGAGQYAVCQACHGEKGQGLEATKGPPLAGQYDWYLVNQLKKFKGGVRGAHPLDTTGAQMRPMAAMLADEQAMKNVVAHIATFSR